MALIPAIGAAVIGARAATKAASRGRKFDSFEDALRWAKGKLDEIVGRGDGAAPPPGGTPTPGGPLVPSDPDFAIGQIASGGNAKASDLADWGVSNGWTRTQTANGPIKFVDENGVTRLTIKKGRSRVMTMVDYFEHPALEQVYLEDSFVLDFAITPRRAVMRIEFVLREEHDLFTPPAEDEQYCYRQGRLVFDGAQSVTWRMPAGPPTTDATGEVDYGGIDEYTITNDRHHLLGDIGEVLITCDNFRVEFDQPGSV